MFKVAYALVVALFAVGPAWAGNINGKVTFNGVNRENAAVHLDGITRSEGPPAKGATMIQKKQTFLPAVLPVIKGTKVSLPNKDTVFHNAFSLSKGNAFDLGQYGPGVTPSVVAKEPGMMDVFCNMHEQMHALVLVLEHPYFGMTDKNGGFSISNVPAGSYEIKAWVSPRTSKVVTVKVPATGEVKVDFEITK